MATAKTGNSKQTQVLAENVRLRAENERLKRQLANDIPASRMNSRFWRRFGAAAFGVVAVVLLITGNLLFWAGNTMVKNDRFNQTVSPIIKNTEVQKALAKYTTTQLYSNVDVTQAVQNVLPPRADFLAPTIASSLQGSTQAALTKVLARPQFQDRWNKAIANSHARFIDTIRQSGGDGVISLDEAYQQLGDSLHGTKLAFLADRKLPAKVGQIQVASGEQIRAMHQVVVHIDAWRFLAVLLFLICAAASVFLSLRRRRTVLRLALGLALAMFLTLVALRLTREVIAGGVQDVYAQAVREAMQIVLHSLVLQTTLLLSVFLIVAGVAWLTGPYRSAAYARSRVELLFAGKLHHALFGKRENAFTLWVGRYKAYLEWTVVGVIGLCMLLTRLTASALVWYVISAVLLVLVVELLGAPKEASVKRKAE